MFWRPAGKGFLIILLLSGCAETRLQTVDDSILQKQLALLEDGKTTKENILLKFGVPSSQFGGEKILTYSLRFNQKENRFDLVSREVDRRDPRFTEWIQTEYNLVLVFDDHRRTLDRLNLPPHHIQIELKDKGLYDIVKKSKEPEEKRDKSDKAVFEPADSSCEGLCAGYFSRCAQGGR